MQILYRCKNCKYIHNSKVSSCDCGVSQFEYTRVAAFDVVEQEQTVPDLASLKYTKDEWEVNVPERSTSNGVFARSGRRDAETATCMYETVAHVMGTGHSAGLNYSATEAIANANLVLVSAAPMLLEACYSSLYYLQYLARTGQPSKRNKLRQQILIEAIVKATDTSPLKLKK